MGALTEVSWTPSIDLNCTVRWERIRITGAAVPRVSEGTGNQTVLTAAVRHTFELTSRTEVAVQLEVSSTGVESSSGAVPTTTAALAALDFAF